jgi:hypothetical protein
VTRRSLAQVASELGRKAILEAFFRVLPALPENGLDRPMLTFWSYNSEIILLSSFTLVSFIAIDYCLCIIT